MGDKEDRDAIFRRRQQLIALALAGLATSGCDKIKDMLAPPQPCLSPPITEPREDPKPPPAPVPTPCLSQVADPLPVPCLEAPMPEPETDPEPTP